MKKFILSFICIGLACAAIGQFSITVVTNKPSVKLTVTRPDILNADAAPVTPKFSSIDFIVSSNVVSLNPNRPFIFLSPRTIDASTNSTFGFGAGMVCMDTNYLYLSIATNTWRRISIPTNTW